MCVIISALINEKKETRQKIEAFFCNSRSILDCPWNNRFSYSMKLIVMKLEKRLSLQIKFELTIIVTCKNVSTAIRPVCTN